MKPSIPDQYLSPLVLLFVLIAASVVGCAGHPIAPKETDAQRHARLLKSAKTFHLVVTGSPWDEFEVAALELIGAFRLQHTNLAGADLQATIALDGRVTKGHYERMVYMQNSGPIRTGKISLLDVGFTAKGEMVFLNSGEPLRKVTLFGSAAGPQSMRPGQSFEARRISKQAVLQETLADLCKQLMEIFPDRLPLKLVKQGTTVASHACLEWQQDRHSRQVILEQLFAEKPSDGLLVRMISALRAEDRDRFEDRFPDWLSSGETSVQVQAARKIVELTPYINARARQYPRRAGTRFPLSKARLAMVKRNNWILDAIPQADDEARLILVKGIWTDFIGEVESAAYASKDWHVWCGLQQRIDQMRHERLQDPMAKIRLAVFQASPTAMQCSMTKQDPSPSVRQKVSASIRNQQLMHKTRICNCTTDIVVCEMDDRTIRPGMSHDQLKKTANFLAAYENRILSFGTQTARRKYMRMFSEVRQLLGDDHGMIVQETGGQPEDFFDHYFQGIRHHCDAEVRKLALEELPATSAQLRDMSARDPDDSVRRLAASVLSRSNREERIGGRPQFSPVRQ